jgi:3-oxoacyl-[acyl-carrier protein] reductase
MSVLQGKVCLVTGSTRGIGRAIAERFVAEGGHVVVHGRSAQDADKVAAELDGADGSEGGAGRCLGIAVDLTEAGAADELIARTLAWRGRLDVLVNNAGVARDRFVTKLSDDDWAACLQTNATAPFQLLRAAVPAMKDDGGAVLNIVSWAGMRGNVGQAAYSASKGALYSLTLSLAKELGKFAIRVNALSPMVETEMTRAMPEKLQEATLKRVPLHRFGTMAEVAEGALYLCSDRASFTTGQVLNVDGGIHLT